MGNMKSDRIGATPKDELKWVLRVVYATIPRTKGDKLNLLKNDLMLFAMGMIGPVPIQSDRYLDNTLTLLHTMIEKAIALQPITETPRPYSPRLVWDPQTRRYKKDEQKQSEYFETRAAGRLGELILSHGHLLKICKAPEKMKAGRKPKNTVKEKPRGICGKRFLATRETQLYCSSPCLDRALVHKKAAANE